MTDRFSLTESDWQSDEFLDLFSANLDNFPQISPWATPYAVSVFGSPILAPDNFNGFGYGDGRALSLGEFVTPGGEHWELQWKGSGTTPFSRAFDGRAVLRSSVREFLASECMYHLGVPTTRAFSLVASRTEYIMRGWYRDGFSGSHPHAPNVPVRERLAITTRAAPSFLRVGQMELFSRRTAGNYPGGKEQLEQIFEHALKREFPDIHSTENSFQDKLVSMVREFAARQALLTTEWIRVGYVQGNYNSDNCLLSGRTMDYGPFGFVEKYDPFHNPFTSDPERKYGFERQTLAGQMNLVSLARCILNLIDEEKMEEVKEIVEKFYAGEISAKIDDVRRRKLGLEGYDETTRERIWLPLSRILHSADYTLFFRELSHLSKEFLTQAPDDDLLGPLKNVFYEELNDDSKSKWINWMRAYGEIIGPDDVQRGGKMRESNPKYIPREWMLVQAYQKAEDGDYQEIYDLQKVFASPYCELPEFEERYYRTTPSEFRHKPGVAFYS